MSGRNLTIGQAQAIHRLVSWATDNGRQPGAEALQGVTAAEALAAARALAGDATARMAGTGQGCRMYAMDLLRLRPTCPEGVTAADAAGELVRRLTAKGGGTWPDSGADVTEVLCQWLDDLGVSFPGMDGEEQTPAATAGSD